MFYPQEVKSSIIMASESKAFRSSRNQYILLDIQRQRYLHKYLESHHRLVLVANHLWGILWQVKNPNKKPKFKNQDQNASKLPSKSSFLPSKNPKLNCNLHRSRCLIHMSRFRQDRSKPLMYFCLERLEGNTLSVYTDVPISLIFGYYPVAENFAVPYSRHIEELVAFNCEHHLNGC